jgi:CheY-like chemotaxis protein
MPDLAAHLPYILIVDDDLDQLFLTRRMLEKAKVQHPIVEVTGGPEAIDYLTGCCSGDGSAAAKLPFLMFLDLKMPTVDGFAVLRWMRGDAAYSQVKVIVLTSSDSPEDVKRCTSLGAQGYLVKHPSAMVVDSILREVFGEHASAVPTPSTAVK